jgi:hypothetical protein
MTTSSELLQQAKVRFQSGERNHRDTLLAVGHTLHDFVLAFLKEGDGMPPWTRLKKSLTRKRAIQVAAESLDVSCKTIRELIITSQAAELLGCDLSSSTISHAAIRYFQVFIERCRGTRNNEVENVSSHETWRIKEGDEKRAKTLFRRAVSENWGVIKTMGEVLNTHKSPYSRQSSFQKRRAEQEDRSFQESLTKAVAKASPGDVAEMCIALVEQAEEPHEVAVRLVGMLERFLPKKKRTVA